MHRRTEEEDLLFVLRMRADSYLHIRVLANAFLEFKAPAAEAVVGADGVAINAIAWAMQNEKILSGLVHLFAEFLSEDGNQNYRPY